MSTLFIEVSTIVPPERVDYHITYLSTLSRLITDYLRDEHHYQIVGGSEVENNPSLDEVKLVLHLATDYRLPRLTISERLHCFLLDQVQRGAITNYAYTVNVSP